VLDVLVQRTEVELPPSLIDEEIRHRWAQQEYPVLVDKDFTTDELEEAWQGWRTHAATRLDAEWRLRVALALRAIAARDGIQPRIEDAEALCDAIAESAGVRPEELEELFDSTPAVVQRFESLILHAAALDHVLSKVELTAHRLSSLGSGPGWSPSSA
jgi:trigger factor